MKGEPSSDASRQASAIRSWVRLDCAGYRVCVPADSVVSVDQDVGLERSADAALPFLDLAHRWGGAQRTVAPWVVWLQHGDDGVFGIAIDRIRHFNSSAPTRPFPTLGLGRADLFEGCLEHEGAVLLVLSLAALVELTAEAR